VRLRGRYLAEATILVRNRPLDGAPGYRVLVPLRLEPDAGLDAASAAQVVLVDRGWLPIGATGQGPDDVPAPPEGVVEVVARLRPPEPADARGAPQGQTQRINPAALAEDVAARSQVGSGEIGPGAVITGAYAMMASEAPPAASTPRALPRPEIDEGPHLSYALQWVVFAAFFVGGWVVLARRQAADLAWEEQTGQPAHLRPRSGLASDEHLRDEDIEDAQVDLGGTPGYDTSPGPRRR
jgi:cytochrome oxidase assembly protein ShyY1